MDKKKRVHVVLELITVVALLPLHHASAASSAAYSSEYVNSVVGDEMVVETRTVASSTQEDVVLQPGGAVTSGLSEALPPPPPRKPPPPRPLPSKKGGEALDHTDHPPEFSQEDDDEEEHGHGSALKVLSSSKEAHSLVLSEVASVDDESENTIAPEMERSSSVSIGSETGEKLVMVERSTQIPFYAAATTAISDLTTGGDIEGHAASEDSNLPNHRHPPPPPPKIDFQTATTTSRIQEMSGSRQNHESRNREDTRRGQEQPPMFRSDVLTEDYPRLRDERAGHYQAHQHRQLKPTGGKKIQEQQRPGQEHPSRPRRHVQGIDIREPPSEHRPWPNPVYHQTRRVASTAYNVRPPRPRQLETSRRRRQPVLRRLWKNVERGLDGLADIEDKVTDRAQKAFSATVGTVRSVPSAWGSTGGNAAAAVPQMDLSRFRKAPIADGGQNAKPGQKGTASASEREDGAPARHSETSYKKHAAFSDSNLNAKLSTTWTANGRSADSVSEHKPKWSDIISGNTNSMIYANGGASNPSNSPTQRPPWDTDTEKTSLDGPNQRQQYPTIGASSNQARDLHPRPVVDGYDHPPRAAPDEDETTSFLSRVTGSLRMPSIKLNPFARSSTLEYSALDAWKAEDEEPHDRKGVFGSFRRKTATRSQPSQSANYEVLKLSPPLANLMERCGHNTTHFLLTEKEKTICLLIGRCEAMLSILGLALILVAARSLADISDFQIPKTLRELLTSALPMILSSIAAVLNTWIPFAWIGALLALAVTSVYIDRCLDGMAKTVGASVEEVSQYGVLFLRLVAATPPSRAVPAKMRLASTSHIKAQVYIARLRFFVLCALTVLFLMADNGLGALATAIRVAFAEAVGLQSLRSWPPVWKGIADGMKPIMWSLGGTVGAIVKDRVRSMRTNPLQFSYEISIFAALVLAVFVHWVERTREFRNAAFAKVEEDAEVIAVEAHQILTEQVSNLGVSGAGRLSVLSNDGGVDSLLERWRMALPRPLELTNKVPVATRLRFAFYSLVSAAVLSSPLLVYHNLHISGLESYGAGRFVPVNSVLNVAMVVAFTLLLVWKALWVTIEASEARRKVGGFLASLADAVERKKRAQQASAVVTSRSAVGTSPSAGIVVKDLWAAHRNRRAWAVCGLNLSCRNGEMVLLLGVEGSGKTRILTTLAESIISPAQSALSVARARGSVCIGGLDVQEWNEAQLRRRVGLVLNDVRRVSDAAQIHSGLTIEEILEPTNNRDRASIGNASAAVMRALKITELHSTLLSRLPSKLSTVVTASEEDLKPSPLRPRYEVLSPAEWSKLLLTRVLAQAIYDNDCSPSHPSQVDTNCLGGSVLLLDDVTAHLSEMEESNLWRDLRNAGAATIITSNRWSSGRFADQIAVVKDGALIETGTHDELLDRGPQHSVYAAKWYAMTMAATSPRK